MVLVERLTQPLGPLKAMEDCRLADTPPHGRSLIISLLKANNGSAQRFHDRRLADDQIFHLDIPTS